MRSAPGLGPFVQLWRHHDARCLNLGVFFHSLSMVGEQVVLAGSSWS